MNGARCIRLPAACRACVAALPLIATIAPNAIAQQAGPDCGRWCIDHARHMALSIDAGQRRQDADRLLIWMLAAARLSPDEPRAYWWQYDLASRLGRSDAARAALQRYVQLAPQDTAAVLLWHDVAWNQLQTSEKREAFARQRLEDTNDAELVSDLQRRLATLYYGRGEADKAETCARAALDALASNHAARELLGELTGRDRTPAGAIELLLARVATAPGDWEQLWQLAGALDGLSMHEAAAEWYAQAAMVHRVRGGETTRPPSALLVDWARSALDGGRFGEAVDEAKQARQLNPADVNAAWVLLRAYRKLGRHDEADALIERLGRRFAERAADVLDATDAFEALQIAWFHLEFDPDPRKALDFATVAYQAAPDIVGIQRVYGLACLHNDKTETAAHVLGPLAPVDQWAAEGMAQILLQRDEKQTAIDVLRVGRRLRYSGPAHERIVRLLQALGVEAADAPDRSAIEQMLTRFDRHALRFALVPNEYLSFKVECEPDTVQYGGPFACRMSLENTSGITITLGDNQMVQPDVYVSLRLEHTGKHPARELERYISVSLGSRRVLAPGQSVSRRQRLDLGEARELALVRPREQCKYTLRFLLDGQPTATGVWKSRLPGVTPVEAGITRAPMSGDAPRRKQLLDQLRQRKPCQRAQALEALAGEELSNEELNVAAGLLSAGDWLTRLAAVEFFARRQGRTFEPVLVKLAAGDPDPLVRRMARRCRAQIHASDPTGQ